MNLAGFFLGGTVAALLLVAGRHLSQIEMSELTETGLVGRYTYGVVSLLIGFGIYLAFTEQLAVLAPLFGICAIAGFTRVAVAWVEPLIKRHWAEREEERKRLKRLEMLEREMGHEDGELA